MTGCGTGEPIAYSVTGTVTLDDKPLPNAGVVFTPALTPSLGAMAGGRTDESGRFSLMTGKRMGAYPASYKVTVFLQEEEKTKDKREEANPYSPSVSTVEQTTANSNAANTAPKPPKYLIPEKYTKPDESGLTYVVGISNNHYEIKLTSDK